MDLIKPPRLREGDTVATISLSGGYAGSIPARYAAGKRQIEATFGLRVVEAPNSQRDAEYLYRNPQARVDDLHWALANDDIAGMFSNIGGSESVRLLPMIDFELLRKRPKIFMGLSDSTVQHFAQLHAGTASFSGPSVLMDLAENCGMHPFVEDAVRRVLFSPEPPGELRPSPEWTEEYLEWTVPENETVRRTFVANPGWTWVQGATHAVEGPLLGGCVEVLEMLKGTEWWPPLDRWTSAVLYFEMSVPTTPTVFEYQLRNYGSQGILSRASAILLGRPYRFSDEAKLRVFDVAQKVLREFSREDMPVVGHMDFGHTSPMCVIPNGCTARVDAAKRTVALVEAAVA